MGKFGFIVLVVAIVLVAAGNQAQVIRAKADEAPEPTTTPTSNMDNPDKSDTSQVTLELPIAPTATPTVTPSISKTVELQNDPAVPAPILTATPTVPASALQQVDIIQVCSDQTRITWSRHFAVTHTMNRWEVWQQYVSSRVMQWEKFVYLVMDMNPSLRAEGTMFKVGTDYLLPTCTTTQ